MTADGSVIAVPTSRDEAWRYTPVEEILARIERAIPATDSMGVALSRSAVDALAGGRFGPRLVFVNGRYDAELSDDHDLPAGLWCGPAGSDHPPTTALVSATEHVWAADGLIARGDVVLRDVAVVIADDGARFDEPVHIVHVALPDHRDAATSVISHPRTIVDVGVGSDLDVVETYCGLDGLTVTNASTTVRVADGAVLGHCRIQIESSAATHVGRTRIEQGAGSHLRTASITIGGDIARNAIDVHLDAPGARTELSGLNVTGGHQRHDTVVTVDHAASRCASTQRFVGVVDDHGRGSFSGEIIVRPDTVATDAHQSNRNLVLDPNAEADTRPWLQILADDVRCTHGATVGRLDDDAVFYLRSRGVPHAKARAMLIDAFVSDVTGDIAHPSVRAHVASVVASAAIGDDSVADREERR